MSQSKEVFFLEFVRRIFSDWQESGETAFSGTGFSGGARAVSSSAGENHNDELTVSLTLPAENEATFNEAVDAIGEGGLDAIAGALDMFRRK